MAAWCKVRRPRVIHPAGRPVKRHAAEAYINPALRTPGGSTSCVGCAHQACNYSKSVSAKRQPNLPKQCSSCRYLPS